MPRRRHDPGRMPAPALRTRRRPRTLAMLLILMVPLAGCEAVTFVQERGTEPVSEALSSVGRFGGRFGAISPPQMQTPEGVAADALAAAFEQACMANLPTFARVPDVLSGRGWKSRPLDAGGYAMTRAPMAARVTPGADGAAPSCSIGHPRVSREMARAIMAEAFESALGPGAQWRRGAGSEPELVAQRGDLTVTGIVGDVWSADSAPGAAITVRAEATGAQSRDVAPAAEPNAPAPTEDSFARRRFWHGGGCNRDEWELASCQGLVGASLDMSGARRTPGAPQTT